MTSEKFRRELRQEAEQWWQDGMIDARLYEQIAERYQFQTLERDASHQFIAILMGLGGVLLGLAAITFVAANWQVWPRLVKLVLLLTLFLGVNAAGFYLWRRPGPGMTSTQRQRLGQGLLLLGALLLGANLGLMSQMFHQSSNIQELFLVWGLGVVAMAVSLRLTSLGLLAWILLAIGYTTAWLSQWGIRSESAQPLLALVVQHMSLVAAGLFVPLAYRCRSPVLFALAGVGATVSLGLNLSQMLVNGWVVALATLLPPMLLWSYSSRIWRAGPDPFQPLARSLALWWLGLLFSGLAFKFWWQESWSGNVAEINWPVLTDAGVFLVVAGLGWIGLRHDWGYSTAYKAGYTTRPGWRFDRALHSGTIAAFGLIAAMLVIWQFEAGPIGAIGTIGFNVMLFLLAAGLIRDGLALGRRNVFWGGMVLLVLGIICRMLEYDTGLLLKSIVFALCGLGVIAAGLWFERRPRLTPSSTQEKSL